MNGCLDLVAADRESRSRRFLTGGLSGTRLKMGKHMRRSETQGNGVETYLSIWCLVYAPLMGHSSFIYSTQKLTCQTTHRLYLSKSWKACDSGLKDSSASARAAAALRRRRFSSSWCEPYISEALLLEFQQAWSWQILPFIFLLSGFFFPYPFSKEAWDAVVLYAGLRATAGLCVCNIINNWRRHWPAVHCWLCVWLALCVYVRAFVCMKSCPWIVSKRECMSEVCHQHTPGNRGKKPHTSGPALLSLLTFRHGSVRTENWDCIWFWFEMMQQKPCSFAGFYKKQVNDLPTFTVHDWHFHTYMISGPYVATGEEFFTHSCLIILSASICIIYSVIGHNCI